MRLRDLDLNLLVALDMLLREKHVSRAAARLEMSQSSMSLALSKLRAVFDDPLLVKGGNALVLTSKAQEIASHVTEALGLIDQLVHTQRDFDPLLVHDTLTLIVTDYIEFVLVPKLMNFIYQQAPNVKLRIVGPNPGKLGEVFSNGEVDLSVSYFPEPPTSLRVRSLFTDRLVGIARRGHPFLSRPTDLQAYCDHGHVIVEPGEATMYNNLLDPQLRRQGYSRNIILSKPTFVGVPFIVEQSDLLATLPETLARALTRFTDIEIFEPPLTLSSLNIVLLWHERTHTNPLHRWFREQVIALCAQEFS